jgi:hypothetical protein
MGAGGGTGAAGASDAMVALRLLLGTCNGPATCEFRARIIATRTAAPTTMARIFLTGSGSFGGAPGFMLDRT